ncbi:hypothetical protein [Streptomyces sp. NBC_00258]|uniref:hypothetical protein n=1 Tax=Streptomyces sp. NBC_00258 TaxID=2903642 RepID=UPI002E2936A8|nr:hypothetical protein [Streptomyces sp. NBC_00258]
MQVGHNTVVNVVGKQDHDALIFQGIGAHRRRVQYGLIDQNDLSALNPSSRTPSATSATASAALSTSYF